MAYNPDGGTWSCPPQNRQQAHYDLKQGAKYEIKLVIGESFNKPDIVDIVNKGMLNGAEFSYIFRMVAMKVKFKKRNALYADQIIECIFHVFAYSFISTATPDLNSTMNLSS